MPAGPNMEILVDDDMVAIRKIVKNTLKQLGFAHIDEAENGQEAPQNCAAVHWGWSFATGICRS